MATKIHHVREFKLLWIVVGFSEGLISLCNQGAKYGKKALAKFTRYLQYLDFLRAVFDTGKEVPRAFLTVSWTTKMCRSGRLKIQVDVRHQRCLPFGKNAKAVNITSTPPIILKPHPASLQGSSVFCWWFCQGRGYFHGRTICPRSTHWRDSDF